MQSLEYESRIEEFRRVYEDELGTLLDLGAFDNEPTSVDPFTMGLENGATFEELTVDEMEVIKDTLLGKFVDSNHSSPPRVYRTPIPPNADIQGEIEVTVFPSIREDGISLHKLTFPDGKQGWVLGPDIDL